MKKYIPKILLTGLTLFSLQAFGQAPYTEWEREIKSFSGSEDVKTIMPLADGTFIMAGSTSSPLQHDITAAPQGSTDFWLIKMDGQNIVWQTRYGGSDIDVLSGARQTPDGGYILWGLTNSPISGNISAASFGDQDIWIVKVDANGNLQWQKRFGHAGADYIGAVQPHKDGGYLIGGAYFFKDQSGNENTDGWLIKVDAAGNVAWEKNLKSIVDPAYNFNQYIYDIREVAGDYYIFSASEEITSKDASGISISNFQRLTKLKADGTIAYDKILEADNSFNREAGGNLLPTADNNLLLFSFNGSQISKVDLEGALKWKSVPLPYGAGSLSMRNVVQTSDGSFFISGEASPPLSGGSYNEIFKNIYKGKTDGLVMKISKDGQLLWGRFIGSVNNDRIGAVFQQADGSLITANLYRGFQDPYRLSAYGAILKLGKLSANTDNVPPSAPAAPQVSASACNSHIQWTASTDDRALDGYLLYHGDRLLYAGPATSYSFSSTYDATYNLSLYAIDAQGNKSEKVSFSYTTPSVANAYLGLSKVYKEFHELKSMAAAPDGNHVLISYTNSGYKHALTKVNAKGEVSWQQELSGEWETSFHKLLLSKDKHYVVAGTSSVASGYAVKADAKGEGDFIVAKINESGTVVWKSRFGGSKNDSFVQMIPHPLGGYLLAGLTNSPKGLDITEDSRNSTNAQATDIWIVYVDEAGNKVWDKRLGGHEWDYMGDIHVDDYGIIYVGATNASAIGGDITVAPKGGTDFILWKLSASGQLLWDKRFGGSGSETLLAIRATSNQQLVLAGTTNTHTASLDISQPGFGASANNDYWLISLDESGNKLWDKRWGGSATDNLKSVQTYGTHLYLAGESYSTVSGNLSTKSNGGYDIWIVKISESGQEVWQKGFGSAKNESVSTTAPLTDGSLLVAGRTASFGCDVASTTAPNNYIASDPWLFRVHETADTQKPAAPTDLTATELTINEVQLNWSPAQDDRHVRFYRIYVDGVKQADTESAKASLFNLTPKTEYTFEVSAFDMAGNESDRALLTTLILSANNVLALPQHSAYPVPFRESVTIKIPGMGGAASPQITLYDAKGNQVSGFQVNRQEGNTLLCEWKTTQVLKPGLYLYRFYYNQKWFSGKIIRE